MLVGYILQTNTALLQSLNFVWIYFKILSNFKETLLNLEYNIQPVQYSKVNILLLSTCQVADIFSC